MADHYANLMYIFKPDGVNCYEKLEDFNEDQIKAIKGIVKSSSNLRFSCDSFSRYGWMILSLRDLVALSNVNVLGYLCGDESESYENLLEDHAYWKIWETNINSNKAKEITEGIDKFIDWSRENIEIIGRKYFVDIGNILKEIDELGWVDCDSDRDDLNAVYEFLCDVKKLLTISAALDMPVRYLMQIPKLNEGGA